MLETLHIKNYALIETLDIRFDSGFSVITGETGAGKSIILGAIGLLLGQRADTKAIRTGATKCVIEAQFDVSGYGLEPFFLAHDLEYDPHACILRREVQATGKSRAFINDTPVSLAQLKELGEQLVDIHSQHQNLLLSHEGFQLDVLDVLAHDETERDTYRQAFRLYQETARQLAQAQEEAERNKADEEYIRFQLDQLEEARLTTDEQEALEQEADTLNHAEEIKAGLYQLGETLDGDEAGLLPRLKECLHVLQGLQSVYAPAGELASRLESGYIELKELAQDAGRMEGNISFDPGRLDSVNERLNLIYSLEQKHHVSSTRELVELTEGFRSRLQSITSADDRIQELKEATQKTYEAVVACAAELTRLRQQAAQTVEAEMRPRLIPLGMPNVRFSVEMSARKEPDASGTDNVAFLFSANKNGQLCPVASIASGGEIARVMLSLKSLICGETKLPTILFDEIDTGVSGEIADKMADIMQEMGQRMQVISITHLPQIAAKGTAHYKVFKQDNEVETNSHIRRLETEERIEEIAHMLSGATLTEAALNNAKELLKQ